MTMGWTERGEDAEVAAVAMERARKPRREWTEVERRSRKEWPRESEARSTARTAPLRSAAEPSWPGTELMLSTSWRVVSTSTEEKCSAAVQE